MRHALVILNKRAGALIDLGIADIPNHVARVLGEGGARIEVVMAQGRRILRAIARGVEGPYDTLIVGGGDGSVSAAAAALAGSGKTLGVLPLGTVNLFAKDLGMPPNLADALSALAQATPQVIDLGRVNGRPFHTLSGVGFFSQMARAREETRGFWAGRLAGVGVAFFRAIGRSGRFSLDVEIDGRAHRIDAFAVLVTNNRFNADWRRPVLDEGVLEVHVAEEQGSLARLGAGIDLFTGRWRTSDGIRSFTAREVVIGHARRRAWIATDGELVRERLPLSYVVEKRALSVLMQPPQPTKSD